MDQKTLTPARGCDGPLLFLQCFQEEDTRTEILSHLTLSEIQDSFRRICKETLSLSDEYKSFVVARMSEVDREVLLVELRSDCGKLINGQIGRCCAAATAAAGTTSGTAGDTAAPRANGRYRIRLDDLNWV